MQKQFPLCFFLFLCLFFGLAKAVQSQSFQAFVPMQPNHTVSVFLHQIPFAFAEKAQNSFSLGTTQSNTWKPRLYMIDRSFGSRRSIEELLKLRYGENIGLVLCEACPGFELPALEAFEKSKNYRADGVLRRYSFALRQAISEKSQWEAKLSAFYLTGGASVPDFFVSDAFIESFHQLFTPSIPDPFHRQKRPYNLAGIEFNEAQNSLKIEQGEVFCGTLNLAYRRYFRLLSRKGFQTFANAGVGLGLPLNRFNNYVSGSVFFSVFARSAAGQKSILRYGGGWGIAHHRLWQIGRSLHFFDLDHTYTYTGFVNFSRQAKRGIWSAGLEFFGESQFQNPEKYAYLYETTGEPPYDENQALGYENEWLFTMHNQYFGFFLSFESQNKQQIGLKVVEDGNFKRSLLFVPKGSSSQDLAIEVFWRKML